MPRDVNYSPEQHDSISGHVTYEWWCPKCCDFHSEPYGCPYEDYDFCPHCGQLIKRANEGDLI